MSKLNEDWFDNKLKVGRYPLPAEIVKNQYDIIINVSDEYISYCHDAAISVNTKYFWFPMNECSGHIGLNSIYGALQILHEAEENNNTVLLHCHAGANRSPTIRDCYYFMKTGKQFICKREKNVLVNFTTSEKTELETSLESEINFDNLNMLEINCATFYLPELPKMEKFLTECLIGFEKDKTMRGGHLDTCKLNSKINI